NCNATKYADTPFGRVKYHDSSLYDIFCYGRNVRFNDNFMAPLFFLIAASLGLMIQDTSPTELQKVSQDFILLKSLFSESMKTVDASLQNQCMFEGTKEILDSIDYTISHPGCLDRADCLCIQSIEAIMNCLFGQNFLSLIVINK